MVATNGIGGVGVGLGHRPNPSAPDLMTGGTAALHFTSQDMGALMAVHGQFLSGLVADFPVDPAEQAAATVYTQSAVKNGWTRATFSNARIMSMQVVPGGAVEVTVQHSRASMSPPTQSKAALATRSSGGTGAPQPQEVASVANLSRKNVKNNETQPLMGSATPVRMGAAALR